MTTKNKLVNVIMLLAVMSWGSVLMAQEETQQPTAEVFGRPWERLSINLGGFLAGLNGDLRLGSRALGIGIDIDMEEALGLETSTLIWRAGAIYRIGKGRRHAVEFGYFALAREARKSLGSDVDIGDTTYTAGTLVNSEFDLHIIKGTYRYSFFQDDRIDMSASAGFFALPTRFRASAKQEEARKADFTAPLPVLGLRSNFALTPRLFLKQSAEIFYFKLNRFKGAMLEGNMLLEYNAWKHVGAGFGFNTFRLNLEADGEDYPLIDFVGSIKFSYVGLFVYLKYYIQ